MRTFLRCFKIAYRIELADAALWILPALAMAGISAFAGISRAPTSPPPGAVGPPPGVGGFFGPALVFLTLGVLGAVPALVTGFVLRGQHRTRSNGLAGMILAYVFAALFLGGITFAVATTALGPDTGPLDWDFAIIGILIALSGAAHLVAGILATIGRRALRSLRDVTRPGPEPIGPPRLA